MVILRLTNFPTNYEQAIERFVALGFFAGGGEEGGVGGTDKASETGTSSKQLV